MKLSFAIAAASALAATATGSGLRVDAALPTSHVDMLNSYVFPLKEPGNKCFNTFMCKVNGGECMEQKKCLAKGPGHSWRPRLCTKRPLEETWNLAGAINKGKKGFKLPFLDPNFPFKQCGCCVPPSEETEDDCAWGCAPADYSTCGCVPAGSSQTTCENQPDRTGDLVCAYDSSTASCVGCNAYDGDASTCNAQANCMYNSVDGSCMTPDAIAGLTTSPAADYFGKTC